MSRIVPSHKPRERSHRPTLRVLGGDGASVGPDAPTPARGTPVDGRESAGSIGAGGSEPRPPVLRVVPEVAPDESTDTVYEAPSTAPVLLAGADRRRRAILRTELASTLPRRTRFCEADDVAEVLEQAPFSRMMILAGDLDDADAEALMRLLGHRHPRLPVVCVGLEPMPAAAGARG